MKYLNQFCKYSGPRLKKTVPKKQISQKSVNAQKMSLKAKWCEEFCDRNVRNILYVRFAHKKYTSEQKMRDLQQRLNKVL